jgi:hypothetical protein
LAYSISDTIPQFTIIMSKTIRIGGTKYHIYCDSHFATDEVNRFIYIC